MRRHHQVPIGHLHGERSPKSLPHQGEVAIYLGSSNPSLVPGFKTVPDTFSCSWERSLVVAAPSYGHPSERRSPSLQEEDDVWKGVDHTLLGSTQNGPFTSSTSPSLPRRQRYLTLANTIRKPEERLLFISSKGTRADVDTLRCWVTELLQAAGVNAPAGSCRSASTSAAVQQNVDIDHVLKSAGWARKNTFHQYYQRSIHPLLNCETLLPLKE